MKKLTTLLFVLVFASSMAYAQNDATVDQDGNDNNATVNQTYTSGAMNEASINQIGNDNTVERLNQLGGGNWFGVTQDGDDNLVKSHAEQGSNAAESQGGSITISQTNDGNGVWDADQAGSENNATIYQDGDDVANIEAQVSPSGGSGNTILIDQMDGANSVGAFSSNGPGAYQEGEGNSMDITQNGGAAAGTESKMITGVNSNFFRGNIEGGQGLIQFGNDNEMRIDQDGASTVEFIVQDGNLNVADVMQTGNGHTASVSQVGSNNGASIIQN
ncbi:Curlin associated repeat-containing protein [Fodinibius roseus]|uniref:Curlin associated repeat-containing protein n=1 Tax=Fodinibius roseus TaxID=1194090 RepID=A0A1M5AS40_9BACT|nr:hypothetical protein [Fodinibius roseus]SHF32917.1 Curlin associated repeat-containing protein [Fodinibius roseus]